MVGNGQLDLGLTDNDDCEAARSEGGKIASVVPDQSGLGTLAIPITVGMIKGPHRPRAPEQLIAYLLRARSNRS